MEEFIKTLQSDLEAKKITQIDYENNIAGYKFQTRKDLLKKMLDTDQLTITEYTQQLVTHKMNF